METFPGVKKQQLSFGPGCEMQLWFLYSFLQDEFSKQQG